MSKQALIDALNLLPDGLDALASVPIPTAPTVATPTTPDEAIIAMGVLSRYLSDLFQDFQGLTPVAALLHSGQHNSALQGIFLSGLRVTG